MSPAFKSGDIVIVRNRKIDIGDVVLARLSGRDIIKRITAIERGKYYLVGDNAEESNDSRHFGAVATSAILGSVMFGLPTAGPPPKLVKSYGAALGWLMAVVMVGMCLTHLYRVDTFLPLLDEALPSGSGFATSVGLLVIFSELFALPFLLRMQLSPLAQALSGALVLFAPLWWVVIDIMTVGIAKNTGQLGEFAVVPSTIEVLVVNVVWLMVSFYTLYCLGYGRLQTSHFLRKS